METLRGRVLSIIPNAEDMRAVVSVANMPACKRCASGKGCGAGLIAASGSSQEVEAIVAPGLHPGIGDEVELTMSPDNLLRAAFLLYGLPLLGAIVGAAIAYGMSFGDAGAALLAILGLGCGMTASRWQLGGTACARRFSPRIERLC